MMYNNPNWIGPTAPSGTSDHRFATTEFAHTGLIAPSFGATVNIYSTATSTNVTETFGINYDYTHNGRTTNLIKNLSTGPGDALAVNNVWTDTGIIQFGKTGSGWLGGAGYGVIASGNGYIYDGSNISIGVDRAGGVLVFGMGVGIPEVARVSAGIGLTSLFFQLFVATVATLPTTPALATGFIACVSDSTTTTWGASVAGGGANRALVWYSSAANVWKVFAA